MTKLSQQTILRLLTKATQARKNSHAPYSNFCVGSALLCDDGEIFCGCNIENSAFTPTVCAERVALFNAVSQGKRNFVAIAVVGARQDQPLDYCPPCGVCRQALSEFCKDDFEIILSNHQNQYEIFTLGELLPCGFDKSKI